MSTALLAAPTRIGLWLNATCACDQQHGCRWPMNSTDASPLAHPYLADSLYYGPLGVAIFLQQLGATQAGWRGLAPRTRARLAFLASSGAFAFP